MAGVNIVANAIVVDVNGGGVAPLSDGGCNNSYLLYSNELKNNSSVTAPSQSTDSAGNAALYDDASNLKWISSGGGTIDIDFTFLTARVINAMSVAGANLQSASVTWEFYTYDADTASFVKQADGSGKRNNSPIFNIFDAVTTNQVRFRFICTSAIEIGELCAGQALRLPVPPSIGYTPARWNTNNKVNIGQTEANTMSKSTVLQRGATESASFENVETDWLDNNWIDVIESQGAPVWFSGDQKLKPNDVIYGHLKHNAKPSYTNSFYSTVTIDIDGAK